LTLAVDLARRGGWRFLLVDESPEPFHGSRGKGIQPRSQEVFEDLGVLDRLVAAGGLSPRIQRVYREGGSTDIPAEEDEPTPGEPYQAGLHVPQFRTEAVLRERLAELGESPCYGWGADRVRPGRRRRHPRGCPASTARTPCMRAI